MKTKNLVLFVVQSASSERNRCSSRTPNQRTEEHRRYLIAHGKLHRAKEKPHILPESPSSLPNLRLARHVNIADLVHMHKPPPLKTTIAQRFSKINADLLIHYYLLYLYIYGNC